jgi:hypothetical protein
MPTFIEGDVRIWDVGEQSGVMVQLPGGIPMSGTVLHLFNCTSLLETTYKLPCTLNGNLCRLPAGRLLTFGARGTKLLYYDWTTGYLRSIPLTLTDKDKAALATAAVFNL